jgi:hypothetical protein
MAPPLMGDAILRRTMDRRLARRAVVIGHLAFTAPAIAAIVLVPFMGSRMLGPYFFLYYVLAGITCGWQWWSAAMPLWTRWLARNGVDEAEAQHLAYRAHLDWLGETKIGPFALHTTAAAVCGIHLGPWLLSCWFVWIVPLAGMTRTPTVNDHLHYFEVASVAPALIVGYSLYPHFRRLATWAWVVPSVVLAYKMLTFSEPYASVLGPHTSTLFSYFFIIQRTVPTLTHDFGGVDVVRVAMRLSVVAPFYSGVAYSIGALAAKRDIVKKFFGRSREPETEISRAEKI